MNIFNTCQTENYASDYIDTKRQQAQSKDIKIVSRKKKTRRIKTDLPFDLNVSLKSSINYTTNDINKPLDNDISGVIYIDPNNKLFNTNCPYKYLDYTFKPKVYSNIRPTIVITADGVSDGEITKVSPIELTFTTSEATKTFTETDISFNNGTISNFTASSITVYKATFEPTTDGHCTIDVFVDSFIGEGTGNYNIASTQFKLIYDKTPPFVVEFKLSDTALKIGDRATVTLKFSEVVAAFSSNDDITVVNGVLTTMTSSDNITWTGIFTPTVNIEDATNILTLATTYTDIVGNTGIGNTTDNYAIDTTPPTMVITAGNVSSGSKTNDTTLSLTFTASEATTDFLGGYITVTNGALSAFNATSSTVYTATFTPTTTNTNYSISVEADTFTDAYGNLNTVSNTFTWTQDIIKPTMTITAVEVSDGDTSNDATLALTFTSSEATTNFAEAGITVANGAISAFNATSSTVYTATFTPTPNTTGSISVGVGTFVDAYGNPNTVSNTFTWTQDITTTYFPDNDFYVAIVNEIGSGASAAAPNSLYNVSINTITSLDVNGKNISDLTGIEGFTALTDLRCYNNDLHSLNVSQNTALTDLRCYNNDLHSLNVSQNTALTILQCYRNPIATLDVSANTQLWMLQCFENSLTSLDVTQNTALIILNCNDNSLTTLDVAQNTALSRLDCYNNSLTSLNVSQNTALTILQCYGNNFSGTSGGVTSVITTAFTNTFIGTFNAEPQNLVVIGNFCKVADEAAKTHFEGSYSASIPTNATYYV